MCPLATGARKKKPGLDRVKGACLVSESNTKRYQKKRKERNEASSVDQHQEMGPNCGRPNLIADDFTSACIRRIVNSFYKSWEHPTVDKVLARRGKDILELPKVGHTSL